MSTTTTSVSSGIAPSQQQTDANWNANMQQAWQYYQDQLKMDHDQQAITFASTVEAKGNQMLMSCIQNIR